MKPAIKLQPMPGHFQNGEMAELDRRSRLYPELVEALRVAYSFIDADEDALGAKINDDDPYQRCIAMTRAVLAKCDGGAS